MILVYVTVIHICPSLLHEPSLGTGLVVGKDIVQLDVKDLPTNISNSNITSYFNNYTQVAVVFLNCDPSYVC